MPPKKEKPKENLPPPPPPPPKVDQVKFVKPVVAKADEVVEEIAVVKDLKDKNIGKETIKLVTELEQLNPQIKNDLAIGTRLVIRTSEKIEKEVVVEEVVFPKEIKLVSEKGLSNA